LGVGALILAIPIVLLASGTFRLMYSPSVSMSPTYDVGDKFVVWMHRPAEFRRGDIVLADAGHGSLYAKRIAGLPGDRIELIAGIVYINGRPVAQRGLATVTGQQSREIFGFDPVFAGGETIRLAEQFPGEAAPHQIYDRGFTFGDDFARQIVAPGHLFLLGDNRDQSADSRFSREEQGLEQVPLENVRGAPLFFYWTVGAHRVFDDAGH
jgi:signal peptidase I